MASTALYRKSLPVDSAAMKALPAAQKRVPIAFTRATGERNPADTRLIWPCVCDRGAGRPILWTTETFSGGPMYQAIFFDLSGVLYNGTEAVPGAQAAIERALRSALEVRFVTNTSRRTGAQLVADLGALGFRIDPATLYTAPRAARAWVERRGLRPYCLIHRDIRSEFAGLAPGEPDAVVIGDAAEGFTYEALDRAFQLCQAGAPLVGIGRNRYFRLAGRLHLDAGPFIAAIEYAADTEAVIIGKPSPAFFDQVLASTAASAAETLMIGDDVHGDVEGALAAGLGACLVRTGKYQPGDETRIDGGFACVPSVAEAVELALEGR